MPQRSRGKSIIEKVFEDEVVWKLVLSCLYSLVPNEAENYPDIEIFKLACLSKNHYRTILDIYHPLSLPEFGKYHATNCLLSTLYTPPQFQNCSQSLRSLKNVNSLNKAWRTH